MEVAYRQEGRLALGQPVARRGTLGPWPVPVVRPSPNGLSGTARAQVCALTSEVPMIMIPFPKTTSRERLQAR